MKRREQPGTNPPGPAAPLRVGPWEVRPSLNRLISGDETVQVGPRIMQVLVCLARRPGDAVTREELLASVWPDTVVSEEGLTVAISELRRIFRDDARAPRYIETIRKGGYRLIAPVEPLSPGGTDDAGAQAGGTQAAATQAAAAAARRTAGAGRRRMVWHVALLGAILVALVAGLFLLLRPPRPAEPQRLDERPLTSDFGSEVCPDVSPDGTRVAYAWNGETLENLDIYVKQIGADRPLRLTEHPENELWPTWSPDGTRIAFVRRGTGDAIYTVPALGGIAQRLLATGGRLIGLDWSPDGATLIYAAIPEGEETFQIHALDLAAPTPRLLTSPTAEYTHSFHARYSPDGGAIAVARTHRQGWTSVHHMPASGGESRSLCEPMRQIDGLAWTPDGTAVIFSAARTTERQLYRAAVPAGGVHALPLTRRGAVHPSLAARAPVLVYEQMTWDYNVWEVALDPPPGTPLVPRPLINSTRGDFEAGFGPDGAWITFVSDRSGHPEIWLCNGQGAGLRQMTAFEGLMVTRPQPSPDGRLIAFGGIAGGRAAVYVADRAEGTVACLTRGTEEEFLSCWSHDGGALFVTRNVNGQRQLWRMPIDGRRPALVEAGIRRLLAEREGGRSWIARRADAAGLWEGDPQEGTWRPLADSARVAAWGALAIGAENIYFAASDPQGTLLGRYRFADGAVDTLGQVALFGIRRIVVDPPEGRLLIDGYDHAGADLVLVEGFH